MNYFVLLNIFPPEIVNIIYKFILIQKSGEIILHNIRYYHLKNSILYTSLDNMLQTSPINKNYSLISDDNIIFLDFILKNYYSKKYLISYFWHNYLNILSKKIMDIHNAISMNIHIYDNIIMYKSLKKIIALWIALCVKFNINLKLGIKKYPNNISNSDYTIIYVNSNNIAANKKIKNFSNFVFTPCVLDNYNDVIDTRDSFYTLALYRDNCYDKIYY
tara:strand:- start:93 stop:746 length:654 start_codon:yes stop_codon:yes gene_type:complete